MGPVTAIGGGLIGKPQQDIARFYIAVHQALVMEMGQGIQNFCGSFDQPLPVFCRQAAWMSLQDIFQRKWTDILHHIEQCIAAPADIEQGNDMGVGDFLEDPDFSFEAPTIGLIETLRHHLDRHRRTISGLIAGSPHITHPSAPDLYIETVAVIEQRIGGRTRHETSFWDEKWLGSIHMVSVPGVIYQIWLNSNQYSDGRIWT